MLMYQQIETIFRTRNIKVLLIKIPIAKNSPNESLDLIPI